MIIWMKDGKDWINKFYYFYWAIMESILNKLIEMGWKPRNVISKNIYIYKVKDKINLSYGEFLEDEWEFMHEDKWYSFRELTSKESWLWQFVCENGMVKKRASYWTKKLVWRNITKGLFADTEFEYFLIESALCDEDKLEDFLNISLKI